MPQDINEETLIELLLAVELNKQDIDEVSLLLEDQEGNLFANQTDLEKWRFKIPQEKALIYKGKNYYKLKNFNNLQCDLNKKNMSLSITTATDHFNLQTIDFSKQPFVIPTKSPPGSYFNYDTLLQKSRQTQQASGLFTWGVFNKFGAGFTDFLAQSIKGEHCTKNQFTRLNSNWQIDEPLEMRTLIIGDSYTVPGLWGRSVGFGGIQWGTNFGTQPSFITFPLPSARGEAVVPSVVDLYVNNALMKSEKTAAGPFSINSIPVTTGAGAISLVTTDLLGRQQQITVPYYASTALLKPGLDNFSYSLGFIREDFGIKSNDYSRFAFAGNYQKGFTDTFTGESHLELLQKQQTGGLGGSYLVEEFAVLNLAAAASYNGKKGGSLISAGIQHQSQYDMSIGTNAQWTSKSFTQLGFQSCLPPRYLLTSFVGLSLYKGASISASYSRQENRHGHGHRHAHRHGHGPKLSFLNVSFNQTFAERWTFNVSAMTNVGAKDHKALFATLTYAIGDRTTLNVSGNAQRKENQGTVQLTQNLPLGPGYGYNLYAAEGQDRTYLASVSAQNEVGTYTAGVAHQAEVTAAQLQAQGALTLLNGHVHLARSIGPSFGVVEIPGYADVGVYIQNQIVGKTDEEGTLLIPSILPYQNNPIRVELQDLPLDAQLTNSEINAIPYYNSGLLLHFPIKPAFGALMKLALPSGEFLPTGTMVTLNGQQFPVGFEGETYITDLEQQNILQLEYNDEPYFCNVPYQKGKELLPHLGTIQCQKEQ